MSQRKEHIYETSQRTDYAIRPDNTLEPNVHPSNLLQSATGPVTIRTTNDYLFRALLQRNNKVLRGHRLQTRLLGRLIQGKNMGRDQMLAKSDEYINEASETIYQLTQDEHICLIYEARDDYYRRQRSINQRLPKLQESEDTINKQTSHYQRLKRANCGT